MQASLKEIECPLHPSEHIQRVSIEHGAIKDLYCIECLLSLDSEIDRTKLKPIKEFIELAASHYEQNRRRVSKSEEIAGEFLEILAHQNEGLELLTAQIEDEKKRAFAYFDKLLKEITKLITARRDECIQTLDKQLFHYRHNYAYFEKQLKKAYPQENDLSLYPSKEELFEKLGKISNHIQLMAFVKSIR